MTDVKPAAEPEIIEPPVPHPGQPTASFGPEIPASNVLVNVKADNLNIHPSSLAALERIAEKNPAIASRLIDSTDKAMALDGRKYIVAAISAAVVALSIIIGSVVVIIEAGAWAGLFFFLACVAAVAVLTAAFTGKAQDLSWTVKLIPGGGKSGDSKPDKGTG